MPELDRLQQQALRAMSPPMRQTLAELEPRTCHCRINFGREGRTLFALQRRGLVEVFVSQMRPVSLVVRLTYDGERLLPLVRREKPRLVSISTGQST